MIYIYVVSDSHKHFSDAIKEYTKRLGKTVTLKELKPSKKDTEKEIIRDESELLQNELQKIEGYKIMMYIDSQMFSTLDFARHIEKKLQTHKNIVFVIGGAYGVDDTLLKECDMSMSLSPMTFPHGMALLVLIEQLYRIATIKQGKKYHHE